MICGVYPDDLIFMTPFQKLPLANLQLNGIVSFEAKLGSCSAQEIISTLMLHQQNPLIMQRVLSDLAAHRNWWDGFVSGPTLPTTDQGPDPGSLACLRDLWTGWNADTLYLLAPNASTARSLRALAQGWNCTHIDVYPIHFEKLFTRARVRGQHLVIAHWDRTVFMTEEMNFSATYGSTSPQFDRLPQLSECSPQLLAAGLFLRHGSEKLHAPSILDDLQANSQLWYSFVSGPQLPNANIELEHCLRGLCGLPDNFSIDCLYIWSRSRVAAEQLQVLSERWRCKSATILTSPETAKLLALPKGPPIVVVAW
jgi:hypothetical protein